MRISFTFSARVVDSTTSAELATYENFSDFKASEFDLDQFLDDRIADEGVAGGELYVKFSCKPPLVEAVYWCPQIPHREIVNSLLAYTIAQLEDGFGEGGLECQSNGNLFLIIALTDEPVSTIITDDGRRTAGPPNIAIAARDGNLAGLNAALQAEPHDIGRIHQGCAALHLAILYGHPEAVDLLLESGANPNQQDLQGHTPLEACALTNSLSDEQSRLIGQLLLAKGANPNFRNPNGESAKAYAELRGKRLLAAIL